MPPRNDHSASESEAKLSSVASTSRVAAKQRQQAAQQAHKELLSRHVNLNGPYDREIGDPMDFELMPLEALRRYRKKHGLLLPLAMSINGYLLGLEVGRKTHTGRTARRVTKTELALAVKKHFVNQVSRENDIITGFIYKVNNQDRAFKLRL